MRTVQTSISNNTAVLTLARGKVNAINEALLHDLNAALDRLEADPRVDGVVLTGRGKFFSFGFDVPELLGMPREELRFFLTRFTSTLRRLFVFPMPVVAAVNGHATAGGCMLALACDYRVAVDGGLKIGLNEIDLGVSVFRGSLEMLRYWVGTRNAELILNEGTLYGVAEAARIGMIDKVVAPGELMDVAASKAMEWGRKPKVAYRALKQLMRGSVMDTILADEEAIIDALMETWYSDDAQSTLRRLQIHE